MPDLTAYDRAAPAAQKWRKSDNTEMDAIDDFWGTMTGGDTVASLLKAAVAPSTAGSTYAAGRKTGITGTAGALASSTPAVAILLQADPANTDKVLVGDSSGQFFSLAAGNGIGFAVSNLASVYVKSAAGTQVVNYLWHA